MTMKGETNRKGISRLEAYPRRLELVPICDQRALERIERSQKKAEVNAYVYFSRNAWATIGISRAFAHEAEMNARGDRVGSSVMSKFLSVMGKNFGSFSYRYEVLIPIPLWY